jgi:hypothetical protein
MLVAQTGSLPYRRLITCERTVRQPTFGIDLKFPTPSALPQNAFDITAA